jgi:hypothetical protein
MISCHKKPPGMELGDTVLVLKQDPERDYTLDEVCCLLEMADSLGVSIEAGSPLEGMTVGDLDRLVHAKIPGDSKPL